MLKNKITEDLKLAQKNRDTLTVSVLRMALSEIKNSEIEKQTELSDDQVMDVMLSQAKRHKDAISQFKTGGRDDLVQQETQELEILKKYLPEKLGPDEVRTEVKKAISESRAAGAGEMGKVMGLVVPLLKGRADGKLISEIVKEELGNL